MKFNVSPFQTLPTPYLLPQDEIFSFVVFPKKERDKVMFRDIITLSLLTNQKPQTIESLIFF